jgi:hypothetical protein
MAFFENMIFIMAQNQLTLSNNGIRVDIKINQVLIVETQLTSHLGDSGIRRRPNSCNKHGATPAREKVAFRSCVV